ncbi:MAG: PepSY domain-containing protein [Reyranella sp.]|nr:PepSY domain-containing protein [Reyranella sp.]
MKHIILTTVAMLAVTGIAVAQTTTPTTPTMPKTPPAGATTSTSEAAAKTQIEASGYTDVKALKRTDDGSWQGRAMKNDVEVAVSVDGRGNVTQMSQ